MRSAQFIYNNNYATSVYGRTTKTLNIPKQIIEQFYEVRISGRYAKLSCVY